MALQGEIAVKKAEAIGGKTSRERDYIATIKVFYKGGETIDYATRVHAYAGRCLDVATTARAKAHASEEDTR